MHNDTSQHSGRLEESDDPEIRYHVVKHARSRNRADIDFTLLHALHDEFLERWHGRDLGLTRREFRAAMKKTAGYCLDDPELNRIYSKVDSKEEGLLTWGQYIASLSNTASLRANMVESDIKPLFQDKMNFIQTKQRDEIVAIRFIPRLPLYATKINYNSGRYLMLGREGTLTMWSIDLTLLSSYFVGSRTGVLKAMLFIDLVVLHPSTMIAVTSTDRKITIYELGSRGLKEKYTIVSIYNCITCMDYWPDLHSRTFMLLLWGDVAGDIHALELNVNRLGGIFDKDDNQEIITRVVYADLVKHKFPTVHLHKVTGVHDDWVTEIRYIPETRAFLSSSSSHTNKSLCYTDWRGKVETRFYQSYTSVLCFDFNFVIHLVVTGSLDCQVRVWNFFMPNRPISTLKGHLAPVDHVVLNLKTQHVISVDKGHAIKIFDYKEGTVIQSFSGPSLFIMGPNTIEGFFFNHARCQIIIGTLTIGTTSKWVNPPDMAEVSAHDFPIAAVCYSSTFDEVITACTNAVISVWDLYTGRHVLKFEHYSSRTNFKDVPWATGTKRLEVTAMTLDGSERCAVTGANDGTVNLWNFSSGVLLANYELPDNNLVLGLAVDRNVIFATGWCRHIFLLDLDQKSSKQNLKFFKKYHKEDVNCLTLLKGGLIASGSYDGDIMVLTRDTGHGRCRLNPGAAMFPIPLMTTQEEVDAVTLGPTESELKMLESPEISETFIETEDHSIVRGIRIGEDKVLLANPVTGQILRIITQPRVSRKTSASNLIYDVFKGQKVSMQESANQFRAYESSVDVLLSLETRKHLDLNTANIIAAGAEGWIRAWSLNPKGGLKGQFLATEKLGESVKAMTTDMQNEFLITGDTVGYVKVWDLFPFCHPAAKLLPEEDKADRRDRFIKMFIYLRSPFLRDEASEGFERCVKYHKRPPPAESNPDSSLKTPKLLNVFRAHMQAITALTYVEDRMLILSGSQDCSVRVWTITGSFVGHCGAPWVKLPPSAKAPLRPLPTDIRRNASARTFRVIKDGRVPAWARAVRLIKNYLEQQKKEVEKKEGQTAEDGEGDDKAWLAQAVMMDRDESAIPEHLRLSSVVKFTWRDPKKSQFLGMSFKPNLHHRPLSYTPKINMKEDFGQIAAYRQVQISDMSNMTAIPTPQIIIDLDKRRKEEEEEAQMYRNLAKQSKCSRQYPARNRRSVFKKSIGSYPIGAGQTAQNSVSSISMSGHAGKLSIDCLSSPSQSQRASIRLSVESIRNNNNTQNNRAGFDENRLKNSTHNNKAGFAGAASTENPLKNSTHNIKAGFAGATCSGNPLKNSTHNNKTGFGGATCTENLLKNSTHNNTVGLAGAACADNPSTKSMRNNIDDFVGGPQGVSRAKKKPLRTKNDNTARAGFPKTTSTLRSDDEPDLKRRYPQTQHDKATRPQNQKKISTVNNNNDDNVNDDDLLRAVERENLLGVKTSAEATGNRKNSFNEKLSRQQSSRTHCVLPQISETNAPLLEGGALPLSSSTKGEFSRKRTRHNGGGDKVKIGFEVTRDTDDVIATQRDLTSDPSDVSTATSKDDDESTSKEEDEDEDGTPTDSSTSETTSAEKSSSASSGKSEELTSRFPPIGSSCTVNQVEASTPPLTDSMASSLPESLPSISKLTVICPERKKKEQLFRGTGLMMGSFALPALSKRHD